MHSCELLASGSQRCSSTGYDAPLLWCSLSLWELIEMSHLGLNIQHSLFISMLTNYDSLCLPLPTAKQKKQKLLWPKPVIALIYRCENKYLECCLAICLFTKSSNRGFTCLTPGTSSAVCFWPGLWQQTYEPYCPRGILSCVWRQLMDVFPVFISGTL